MPSSVVPVITLWEEFSALHKDGEVNQFARWIIEKTAPAAKPTFGFAEVIEKDLYAEDMELKETFEVLLYISKLHRYMQLKSKPVIKKYGFAKEHEYNMLTHVFLLKNPNKKELAQKMLLENSTAVEITNRLVKRGFLAETNDEADKRSTRLTITPAGVAKLQETYPDMKTGYAGFLNCLQRDEQLQLAGLLQRLEQYHAVAVGTGTGE